MTLQKLPRGNFGMPPIERPSQGGRWQLWNAPEHETHETQGGRLCITSQLQVGRSNVLFSQYFPSIFKFVIHLFVRLLF